MCRHLAEEGGQWQLRAGAGVKLLAKASAQN